eukprot:g45805.t1
MGYSDVTALLNAVTHRTGLVTFHGPMGVDDWSVDVSLAGFSNVLYTQQLLFQAQRLTLANPPSLPFTTINKGTAQGRLIGGNLMVLAGMIPSSFLPTDFTGKILFLEEVDEKSYRIDRLLTQLALAGVFDQIAGFIFGQCTKCGTDDEEPDPADPDYPYTFTWKQVLEARLRAYPRLPAFYGAMFGHGLNTQWIMPIGGLVKMDAVAGTVEILEPVVTDSQPAPAAR